MDEIQQIDTMFKTYRQLTSKLKNADSEFKLFGFNREFFKKLLQVYGFAGKPKLVDNKALNVFNKTHAPEERPKLYHGFKSYEFGNEFLNSPEFWAGNGFSNGFYSTFSKKDAYNYTASFDEKNSVVPDMGRVLEFNLRDSNNGITVSELQKLQNAAYYGDTGEKVDVSTEEGARHAEDLRKINVLLDFAGSYDNNKLAEEFFNLMLEYPFLAVYLNRDYMVEDSLPSYNTLSNDVIVLNRGAMVVNEDEVKRFKEGAEKDTGVFGS